MTDEQKLEKAIMVYAQLCNNLDARNWHYEKDDENARTFCQRPNLESDYQPQTHLDQHPYYIYRITFSLW